MGVDACGPYAVIGPLGRGGWAEVLRGRAPDGREVALKRPLPGRPLDPQRVARFRREGVVVRALDDPGIARLLDVGEEAGRPWLAYELVDGARTLDAAMAGASTRERVRLVHDAARALGAAHARGVVHRDVTPGNVLVDSGGRVRVADFGLAAMAGLDPLTGTGVVVGTPAFLAPELGLGERDATSPRCDVWSLGVLLFLALTGRHPFEGLSFYDLVQRARVGACSPRALRPSLCADLDRACATALAGDPAMRPADGAAFAALLAPCLAAPCLEDTGDSPPPIRFAADGASEAGPSPAPPVAPASAPQRRVGRFVVEGPLARGGVGGVFRGRDPATGGPVAIKFLLDGAAASPLRRERFEREALALSRISHPNVIGLREVGVAGREPFVVMDFVDGRTLEATLREGPLEPAAAARLVRTLALAIAAAHVQGIIHRDLKPDNVLIDRAGTPFVVDLGLASLLDEGGARLTASGVIVGTLGYLAPEQATGEGHRAGPLADVYGLGAVLYKTLTQRAPCDAPTSYEALVATVERPPTPPSRIRPGVPAALDAICLRCLEKDPARRFPSAEALARALDDWLVDGRGARRSTRRPVLAALGLALVVGGGLALSRLARDAPIVLVADDGVTLRVVEAAAERALVAARRGGRAAPSPDDVLVGRREVLAAAEAWAARGPERPVARAALGVALVECGRAGDGAAALDEALRQDPTLVGVWTVRGLLRLHERPADARADAERALTLRPDDAGALALRGQALALLGDATGGRADLERALLLGCRTPAALAMLAHCLLSLERDVPGFRRAADLAGEALAHGPSTVALAARAKARLWSGDDALAAEDYAELLASAVDVPGSTVRRAMALTLGGDRGAARRVMSEGGGDEVALWAAALGDGATARRLAEQPGWVGAAASVLLDRREAEAFVQAAEDDPRRRCLAATIAGAACEADGARAEAQVFFSLALATDARGEPAYDWALRRARALSRP